MARKSKSKSKASDKKNIFILALTILLPLIGVVGGYYLIQSRVLFDIFAEAGVPDGWTLHVIDGVGDGADGVKLADVNKDGYQDISTGWEQGGSIRLYMNPGPSAVTVNWPKVEVGKVGSPEDALLFDYNNDGNVDAVSATEGSNKKIYIHTAPSSADTLNATKWTTQALPASVGVMQWMFVVPLQVDGKNGVDIVAGGKNSGAQIGWFESPSSPSILGGWKWHPMSDAGWVMSIIPFDMDADGDKDILVSDRHNDKLAGVRWLKNPGPAASTGKWEDVTISSASNQVRFTSLGDLDRDGLVDVVTADAHQIIFSKRLNAEGTKWEDHLIPMPSNAGFGKGINVADVDLNGKPDIVLTFVHGEKDKISAAWMSYDTDPMNGKWTSHNIGGSNGIKFDVAVLDDLDRDGDSDLITTEENEGADSTGLGVIWYENPTRHK